MAFSIGIDLGTTNTVVALARKGVNGNVEVTTERIIQIGEDGFSLESSELLPSVLYVHEGEHMVGKVAKAMKAQSTNRVIANSKNFIGEQNYFWEIDGKEYSPEIVASYFLGAVRKYLEDKYTAEMNPNSIVITVPASFDLDQKEATKKAARLAGFNGNITCISEPTAAMLDFINSQQRLDDADKDLDFKTPKKVLVFDLGGGTCDIAILEIKITGKEICVEELGVSPHTLIGGTNFDAYGVEGVIRDYNKQNNRQLQKELSQEQYRELRAKLLVILEKSKIYFTGKLFSGREEDLSYPIQIPNILDGEPFRYKLSMTKYNEYIAPLLDKENKNENIITPIETTLQAMNMTSEEIDYVFCVGGMTQYPKVLQAIEGFLGKKAYKFCDSMQSVAKGAAAYQHYEVKDQLDKQPVDVIPTLPQSVFINVKNGFPQELIKAKTKAGEQVIHKDFLEVSSETQIVLQLYTGRSYFDPELKRLNDVVLSFDYGIPVGSKVSLKLEYTIQGTLQFEAWVEKHPETKIHVSLERDKLSNNQIKDMQQEYGIQNVGGIH